VTPEAPAAQPGKRGDAHGTPGLQSGEEVRFFCARPRRFGKTLMTSTLASFFQGRKSLFRGLDIEEYMESDAYAEHPVISLDMSFPPADAGIDALREGIMSELGHCAKINGVHLRGTHPAVVFGNLMSDVHDKHGPIALIIDEYDAPLLDTLDDERSQEEVRKEMRNFYKTIKSSDSKGYIYFTFLTGISKFAKLGVFSGLNNVKDISFSNEYHSIFGYTNDEISKYFSGYIDATADAMQITTENLKDELRDYYDGYYFGGDEHVYNPVSIAYFFNEKKFGNFWIETGSQEFIKKYLSEKNFTVEEFDGILVSEKEITSPGEITRKIDPEFFLYQAGYLTVRKSSDIKNATKNAVNLNNIIDDGYYFMYQNYEVRGAMFSILTNNFFTSWREASILRRKFASLLKAKAYPEAFLEFNEVLERIPHTDTDVIKRKKEGQSYYRGPIIGFIYASEMFVLAEVPSTLGKSDIVFFYDETAYVVELKTAIGEKDALQELVGAMQQIEEKKYTGRFANPLPIGIVIDEKVRAITHICVKTDVFHVKDRTLHPIGKIGDMKVAAPASSGRERQDAGQP
jgi:hypothetical protein